MTDKEEAHQPPLPLPTLSTGSLFQNFSNQTHTVAVKVPRLFKLPQIGHKEQEEELSRVPNLGSLASQIIEFKRYEDTSPEERPRCLLAHPSQPHYLTRISARFKEFPCCLCGQKKNLTGGIDDYHFVCNTCDVEFHHGCHAFPRKTTHPYHLQHPLTLTSLNGNIGESSESTGLSDLSELCTSGEFGSVEIRRRQFDIRVDKCTWCGKNIEANWFYCCSTCNFCLDLSCFQNLPLLLIANPKSHHHSLAFYPRPLLTPCDACGLVNAMEPSYTCFQCYYMVHQSCIDLPRVIKITRHQHRLLHTPYLRYTISPCRICYKTIDIKYGQYSCNEEDCSYVAHSKCATHEAVWDKKELEWEIEEPDETEEIAPFKKVGNDMIKHFSHEHLLKLEKFDDVRDVEMQCQACILPINSRDFYKCMECDYFLHEVCAGLLRKLNHALHVHPLILHPSPLFPMLDNVCLICSRKTSGFSYKCSIDCKLLFRTQINICCILVPDYFRHKAHEHPLFIPISGGENETFCKGCNEICLQSRLQCTICNFAMCYACCTIPDEIYYKYDKHPLSLSYGEEVKEGMYWCEVCEKEIDPTGWFYTCNECCVTIHRQCLFGSSSYMKPGFTFYFRSTIVRVLPNNSNTRPLCVECGQRCPSSVYYELGRFFSETLCSLYCVGTLNKVLNPCLLR